MSMPGCCPYNRCWVWYCSVLARWEFREDSETWSDWDKATLAALLIKEYIQGQIGIILSLLFPAVLIQITFTSVVNICFHNQHRHWVNTQELLAKIQEEAEGPRVRSVPLTNSLSLLIELPSQMRGRAGFQWAKMPLCVISDSDIPQKILSSSLQHWESILDNTVSCNLAKLIRYKTTGSNIF